MYVPLFELIILLTGVGKISLSILCLLQYAQPVTKKGTKAAAAAEEKKEGEEKKQSNHVQRILVERRKGAHRRF
jgi:hypothetical protein